MSVGTILVRLDTPSKFSPYLIPLAGPSLVFCMNILEVISLFVQLYPHFICPIPPPRSEESPTLIIPHHPRPTFTPCHHLIFFLELYLPIFPVISPKPHFDISLIRSIL